MLTTDSTDAQGDAERPELEAITTIQGRDDSGSGQYDSSNDASEEWLEFRRILKAELLASSDRPERNGS